MQDKIRLYRLNAQQRRNALKIIGGVLEKKREIVFAFAHGSFCDEPAFRDIDLGIFLQGVKKEEYSDIALKLSSEIEEGLAEALRAMGKTVHVVLPSEPGVQTKMSDPSPLTPVTLLL